MQFVLPCIICVTTTVFSGFARRTRHACRAIDAGIISDAQLHQLRVTPAAFQQAAEKACATPLADMKASFPAVSDDGAPYLCLDLSLQFALLTQGLKIGAEQEVMLVKQVEYSGEWFEAAWPLGAAINTLSS